MYRIDAEDYYITTDLSSNSEFDTFVKTLKGRSIKNFGLDVNVDDTIITLSTCTSDLTRKIAVHVRKIS